MAGIAAETSGLEVVRYGRGACTVLRLSGELDLSTTAQVRAALPTDGWDQRTRRHLVLDLRRLRFLDSSGLGVLFELYRRVTAAGGQVVVARPTPAVARVLRLSGFFKLASQAESVDEAVRSLEGDG
ncbi:MAG TPA: anti-sigma factor antagonist [Limnochorda sp.]